MVLVAIVLLVACGKDSPNNSGPQNTDTTVVMDLSVVGDWVAILAIPPIINQKIFVDISKTDSAFLIVTRDPSRDTTKNPAIKDTTLVLTGHWGINNGKDSLLLLCDTSRIIDTAKNELSPRNVRGKTIPLPIQINKNSTSGDIEWEIALFDFVPLAQLLNIDLSNYVALLKDIRLILVKVRQ